MDINKYQEIVYDLLYGSSDTMVFDLTNMCSHIEDCSDLVDEFVSNINRGDVFVIKDSVIVDNDNNVSWKVKVVRN